MTINLERIAKEDRLILGLIKKLPIKMILALKGNALTLLQTQEYCGKKNINPLPKNHHLVFDRNSRSMDYDDPDMNPVLAHNIAEALIEAYKREYALDCPIYVDENYPKYSAP